MPGSLSLYEIIVMPEKQLLIKQKCPFGINDPQNEFEQNKNHMNFELSVLKSQLGFYKIAAQDIH